MTDNKDQSLYSPSGCASPSLSKDDRLAFVQGFLLGLARRLDAVSYQWADATLAADDCRAVATMINQIPLELPRPLPPTANK